MSKNLKLRYFAALRDQVGREAETLELAVNTPAELYAALQERYGLTLEPASLRVAVNDRFVAMDSTLAEGDQVVFIPPVAGG